MSRDLQLLADFKSIFAEEKITACYTGASNDQFDIVENNGVSCMVQNTEPSFRIKNSKQFLVHFIAVDQCLISSSSGYKGKRNDCVLFNELDFCFVELKLDVASIKHRSERTSEAVEQIGATIEHFVERFNHHAKDFKSFGFNYEAYIVFRTKIYPRDSAAAKNRKVKFAERYNVKLFEQNWKEFT